MRPPRRRPPPGRRPCEARGPLCRRSEPATNASCPSGFTAGAGPVLHPGGGKNSTCLNAAGGGDVLRLQRLAVPSASFSFEPGPEQPAPANNLPEQRGRSCGSRASRESLHPRGVGDDHRQQAASRRNQSREGSLRGTRPAEGNGGVSIMADPTLRHGVGSEVTQ